jgi:hypothetical protein
MKLSYFAAIEVSSIVMLSSRDAKLSSWAAAELSVVVVAAELSVVVVAAAVTHVAIVVVAVTHVAAMVVATTQVAAVAVASPNWKIQSLPCQTQCPACTIGRDSQCSFQVFIHHSLRGIQACFYGGQVLTCPQVL